MPDTDVSGQGWYRDEPVGTLQLNPLEADVVATFADSGTEWTLSTRARRSHPGVTITRSATGVHDVAGLPRGTQYHVRAPHILSPTGDQSAQGIVANVLAGSLDADAGTLTVETRQPGTGALADPPDASELQLSVKVETLEDATSF
jgi:hypothetical protein